MTATHPAPEQATGTATQSTGLRPASLAEARLDALLAATSDVVYRMSADWSELQPLDGLGLLAGSTAPVRDWIEQYIPADEHQRVRAAVAEAIATRRVFDLQHRILGPDGAETWTHSRAVPVVDGQGEIVEWFGLARDITESKRTQHALSENEARFQALFEQSTGGIAQVDLQGWFVFVNDRYCEIVGRSRDELLNMRMQDLTHQEDLGGNLSLFAQVAQGLIPDFTIEKRYVRPDGSAVWVQNAVSGIRSADGHVRYITAMVADVTATRTARETQAALAAQRQLALDAARLGWWQYDPATGQVTHDARFAQIYGIDGAGPRHVDDINVLLYPGDAPLVWAAVEAAMRELDPQPYAVEYRICRPDGTVRWLEARGIVSFEGKGDTRRPTDLVGTVADVTERHLTEDILRESEARFRLMADASPAALWLTDATGYCTFLSREWYELTGQTEQEALGLGWTTATHPDDQASAGQAFLDANASRSFFQTEYRLRTADGSYRWAIDLGRPWFSEAGEYAGMVGVVFDIDARKRAEQALEEASLRKDQFLATLAHELRNPLAPISNALQVWPLLEHKPEEAARLREMMGRQVRQMVRLIDDLLDLSRITRGKIELRCERVDLRGALEASIEALTPFIETHRHALSVELPPASLPVRADLGRLVQVFGNLLHNAAKYTRPGGHIRLCAHCEGDAAVVSVRDDGVGIPAEMLTGVFDMFAQVDQSLGRTHGGLGIGLTLVKSLVELHGGSIEARSAGSSLGSEFIVRLPLTIDDLSPADASPPAGMLQGLPLHRILVVDDVAPSADTLVMMLKGLGQDPRAVYDGAAALAALHAQRPHVAFVDIAMPGMDGYELARRICALPGPRPVLVALTGFGQEQDRRRAMEAGFDHHLVKPTSVEALHALLLGVPAG